MENEDELQARKKASILALLEQLIERVEKGQRQVCVQTV